MGIQVLTTQRSTSYIRRKKKTLAKIMSTTEDERGFTKTEMQVMDPRQANFQDTVNLVERNTSPGGHQLVNPEKSGKIRSQFDLVELAGETQTADKFTRATAGSKLSVIAEQVRFLQEQATKILEQAQRDKEINHMACNFKRIPGKLYYIYRQKFHMQKHGEGKPYMSMISPEEWGKDCPPFIAAYKLEHDMTWTPQENIEAKEDENAIIDKILNKQSHLAITFS